MVCNIFINVASNYAYAKCQLNVTGLAAMRQHKHFVPEPVGISW